MQNYVLKLAEKEKKMKGPPNISDQNTPHQARNLGLTSQFPITIARGQVTPNYAPLGAYAPSSITHTMQAPA